MAGDARAQGSRFGLLLGLVVLLAFLLREHFVLAGIVDTPIRGDIREYVSYAWNLVEHGVFSRVYPDAAVPPPDAFRSPGYPWLIALGMWVAPQGDDWTHLDGWYPLMLQAQVLMGAASVLLAGLVARRMLSPAWSVLAALLLAMWPHHVAATGALLSEVMFGFLVLLALLAFLHAAQRRTPGAHGLAGAAFGAAYLVNPLIALFPLLLAMLQWRAGQRRGAIVLAGVFLLPVAMLAARGAMLPDTGEPGRAMTNFVQGSWAGYHDAYHRGAEGDPAALATMQAIDDEIRLGANSPRDGVLAVARRLATDVPGAVRWYAWTKPRLLWDWTIQMGAGGGFYFHQVRRSPLDTSPLLKAGTRALEAINPALTLLALLGSIAMACGWWRWGPAAGATGLLLCYLTALHVVLQSEPRYANAYRGIEAIVVMWTLAMLARSVASRSSPATRVTQTAGSDA